MKTVRAVLAVAMALCAMSALTGISPAAASQFETEWPSTSYVGTSTGSKPQISLPSLKGLLTGGSVGATISCTSISISGEREFVKFKELPAEPTFSGCKLGNHVINVTAGYCGFVFHSDGQFDIREWATQTCETGLTFTTPDCAGENKLTLPSTLLRNGESYTNIGKGTSKEIVIAAEINALPYTTSGFCFGGTKTYTDGVLSGSWQVKGYDTQTGLQQGIYWSAF